MTDLTQALPAELRPELTALVAATGATLARIARDFSPAVFASSLAAEDMVLTDLILKAGLPIGIFSLDTGRLHPETLAVVDAVKARYDYAITLYHPNTYNHQFVTDADPLFEGDFVSVGFLPFEADTAGTTLGDFLTWMEKAGKTPSELAMVGWINASVAFGGLLAAGPEFDRQKVTDATNALTADTAGGLLKPINWSTDHAPYTDSTRPADKQGECVTLVRVTKGKFATVAPPATPWMCWPSIEWSDPEFKGFK